MTENILKRLSIIKLLYKQGVEQSYQNELLAPFSILSFHDSVEMFLKLSAETKNLRDRQNFMQYWEVLPELELKEAMRNLNNKRVNIKHKGLMPAKIDIETARVNTNDFFIQNTRIIFDLEFDDVSLYELIEYQIPKTYLINAKEFLDDGDFKNCVAEVTKGFYELLFQYKESKRGEIHYTTHYDLVDNIHFENNSWDDDEKTPIDDDLTKVFETVNENFKNIERAFQVVSLGIDYKKYVKFKILTPFSHRLSNGDYVLELMGDKVWSKKNCQFLLDFVLESALKLQEFDFDFEEVDTTKAEIIITDIPEEEG